MKEKNQYKEKIYKSFVKKYPNIPLQIIFATVELASTVGKAFDILEDWKDEYPVKFDMEQDNWVPDIFDEYALFQEEK